ncbi:MAG TPA: hypothetical protein GXX22_03510 [Clostridiales bacterium]|nr:hypothetical protein [Clostridiales bacterium]
MDVTIEPDVVGYRGYDRVLFIVEIQKPEGATVNLLAVDSKGKQFDVAQLGYWGPPNGFSIDKDYIATTAFSVKFSDAGEYTISFSLVDLDDDENVLASKTVTVNVTE